MILNPKNVKPLGAFPEHLKIRLMDSSSLILIKPDGTISAARTRAEKDALVLEYKSEDVILFAWAGQYRTDIFLLTQSDLEKNYK